jgi:hypothetical protein
MVGKSERKKLLGRPDNIKMDLRKMVFGVMYLIHWAQDRGRRRALLNTVMNLRVP